ncbi:YoaK family protein [Corallococcus sp. bb12-1]|uniref:YoaK family protein n=1 Tax=Corallococcus sp. bb12-1 TaxID=2996784 RepID=UPI00226FE2BB|nr:YoaK family protein [Corallococcus sp. bb12-1]MCY1044914.1 YoaK family protein [Corallococcus sp. bb12-1]
MTPSLTSKSAWVPAALAFVAGYADAVTFVGAGGIFCAHVTGNFVVLAADLARNANADEWLKLSTFPLFVLAVFGATHLHRRRAEGSARLLLLLQAVAFGAAAAVPLFVQGTAAHKVVVVFAVIAMGIQNAMHRVAPSLGPMTTVMTGNVTQWFVEKVIPGAPENAGKHRSLGFIILAFALGCLGGAFGVQHLGFASFLVPVALALWVRSRL